MLKKIYILLFFLGMFFFPFNEYEGIPFLGEYRTESGGLFLFVGFLLLCYSVTQTKKISLPYKSRIFQVLCLFLVWCFIATLLNGPSVADSYFKQTGGINRFIRQYVSLLISCFIFFIFYWNVLIELTIEEILLKIRKTFLYSLIVASVYGYLEIAVNFFGISFLYPTLKLFDYFPFLEVVLHREGRISSISYEPPFFAIYLITISGWMFSYILTEKSSWKYLPTTSVLVLTFFSGSRTGLMLVFFQFFLFGIVLYQDARFKSNIKRLIGGILIFAAVLLIFNGPKVVKAVGEKIETLDFKGNLKTSISNKSRFGMQYATLQVFKEHPIIGVGFGQHTYYSRLKYPYWATNNNYEFDLWYQNKKDPIFPPSYNMYTRLLAETGIVGMLLVLGIIVLSISHAKRLSKKFTGNHKILAIIVYISLIGLFLNWLQIDTFRMYGLWLSLALLIRLSYRTKKDEESSIIDSTL